MVGAAALSLISFIDGYALAKRYNKRHGLQIPPDRKKAPWLSAVLSRFIPGLGQLYNGDILKALLHAVAWCVVVWFLRASWLLVGAGVLAVLSMIDAYDGAVTINGGGDAFHRRCRPWGIALATVWILMCYLPPPLIAQSCLFQVYRIPGGAMQPCLRANDRVIVDTILFRLRGVRRGDVLLFKAPDRPGRCYTKRVVGMPGETIEIRGGKVVINVKPLEAGGIIDRIAYSNYGTFCRPGQVLRIPDGCYFFLGDRIENSFDSRFFGPVPQEAIMGKVVKIIRPRRRIGPVR
jgi:signal peptidase I